MAAGPEFPSFIKLEYQPNGAAASSFMADLDRMFGNASAKFKSFSAEAQTQLDAALSVTRNSAGSLDLGVPQLEAAATAQRARATAAREVAAATALAAKEEGDYSRQARLAVAATQALAIEEERAAAQATAHAAAATQVQERLNRQASATDMVVAATRRGTDAQGSVINSSRASRFAYIQLGQQMQDMTVQAQMGTSAFIIFGQQVPQAAFALSGLANSANKVEASVGRVATFLAGPWGAAVFVAAAVLGPFVARLFEGSTALEKETEKLQKSAIETEAARVAKAAFGKTEEGVTAAILEQQVALDKHIEAMQTEAERSLAAAKNNLAEEISIRNKTDALLANLEAQRAAADVGARTATNPDELASAQGGVAYFNSAIGDLNDQRKVNAGKLAHAQSELTNWQSFVSVEAGSRDAAEKIKRQYEGPDGLIEAARKRAVAEGKVGDQLTRQVALLKAQEAAKLKELSPSGSNREYGREINSATARSIAQSAGFQVNSADRSHQRQIELYNDWVAKGKPSGNPVAVPGTSAHERGNALDIQITGGVTPESIRKAYAAEGVRLTKVFKEQGHYHIEWSTTGADKVEREAEALARKQKALADWGATAAEHIARVNEQFNQQPRLIDAADAATRDLDKTIKELAEKKPPGFQQLIADAQTAKGVIQDSLVRPFELLTRDSERRLAVERLITQGKEDEANALQTIWQLEERLGPLSDQRKAAILDQVKNERIITEELRRRQDVVALYLDATRSVKQELVSIFSGTGSIGNIKNIFKQLSSQVLVEKLFGGAFRDLDKWLKGQSGLGDSIDYFSSETDRASTAAGAFADAVNGAAAAIAGGGQGGGLNSQFDALFGGASAKGGVLGALGSLGAGFGGAANDNGNGEIVVTAARGSVNSLTPEAYFRRMSTELTRPLVTSLEGLLGKKLAGQLGGVISGGLNGFLTAGPAGGVLGALQSIPGLPKGISSALGKGLAGAQTGTLVSGVANSLGIKLSQTGAQIGGAIGKFIPIPGGAIIGSIAGGIIGNLFKTRPRGGGSVSNTGLGVHGNTADINAALNGTGSSIQSSLANIAGAFGGTVGNYNIGIGRYKDYYQVSSNPNDSRLGNSYFGRDSKSALYDGTDAEAAMRAAILAAIQQGAIQGITEGAKRLLAAGQNLDAQVQKALEFQGVFDSLKQLTDPVGFALDTLNKKFDHLRDVFKEAGASTEEYAKLEQLYGLQRADAIKQATEALTGSLRSLYDELTVGNDALSLRDRKSMAQAKYDPLAARVAAGDTTAYNDYADAARTLLGIERSLSGSQNDYFALLAQVTGLTKTTLDKQQGLIDTATGSDSPFSTTSATAAANDNQSVVTAVEDSNALLNAINNNLGALLLQGRTGGRFGLDLAQVQYY